MNSICPGCGVALQSKSDDPDARYNASSACAAEMAELSAYTLTLGTEDFIHQLVVDTYAASHWKPGMKPIMLAFALIGLYLVCEKNYTGREVQLMHMKLANASKVWPEFSVPDTFATLTVHDVLSLREVDRPAMILEWSQSVWGVWRDQIDSIASILDVL